MDEVSLAEITSDSSELEDLKDKEKETPAETPAEKKPEEKETGEETAEEKVAREAKEQEEEDKIPFHKHPRFKALVEEKNRYKTELDKLREDVESKFSEIKDSHSEIKTDIPDWFTELYGENETAWKKYQTYDKKTRDDLKAEIKAEFESTRKLQEDSVKKQDSWIDGQITSLKEDGVQFDKNELMKVMYDNSQPGSLYNVFDKDGNLDFKKGIEIMSLLKKKDPEKSKARKEIADDSGSKKVEPTSKQWLTPEDLKGGW